MSFNNPPNSQVRAFVSETQLEEKRKKRQEEWEKVRQPHQPEEAPEEEYDGRSLYHRLQEQKHKKDAEFEEAHKLKNMIKGLDDDEIHFLDLVDRSKEEMEARILSEEDKVLEEYRRAVASLSAENEQQKRNELKNSNSTSPTTSNPQTPSNSKKQHALLAGVIKRKSSTGTADGNENAKRIRLSNSEGESLPAQSEDVEEDSPNKSQNKSESDSSSCAEVEAPVGFGVLPGLSAYSDSSDSELSSGSELFEGQEEYDLVGRPRTANAKLALHGEKA